MRFLLDVGISPAYVSMSDKMINTWTSIVEYAMHEHMLDELIAQARKEFPRNKELGINKFPICYKSCYHDGEKGRGSF